MMPNAYRSWVFRLLSILMLPCLFLGGSASAADFLEPDQAFRLQASMDGGALTLKWDIAKGYKLYKDKLDFSLESGAASMQAPDLPVAKKVVDPYFKQDKEIYKGKLSLAIPIANLVSENAVRVKYQGCADTGLCYQPIEKRFVIGPNQSGKLAEAAIPEEGDAQQLATAPAESSTAGQLNDDSADESGLAQRTLKSGSMWKIGLGFMVFGLLLSFTPCVLPMIPILSSIIVGQSNVSRARGFLLALSYCLGMALVYTSMGVAAGLAGEGLAASLQKPWVLITFATMLVIFSLSMFDVFQLQMPSFIRDRLGNTLGKTQGGRMTGVFAMGAVSSLIVGPCVAGPLAGALVYISQTKDVMIGGWALFAMATGMSAPLLLTGISAGSLLPRAGAWMSEVKYVFGLLLLAVAIWMIVPILNAQITMILFGAYAILCAVFLKTFESATAPVGVGRRFQKALGIVVFLLGCIQLLGAMAGAKDPMNPLKLDFMRMPGSNKEQGIKFIRVANVGELEKILKTTNKPVLLDFYADWCVSCKEMEKLTFSDPRVIEKLQKVTLLQADVTMNSPEDRALMKKFGLFGPPGLILFNSAGSELEEGRVIGFVEADKFVRHIDKYL